MEGLFCNDSYVFDTEQMCFHYVCLAVVYDAIWRIIYVVVSLLVWLFLNLSSHRRYEIMSPYFYPGHIFRWIIYPLVLIVLLTSIIEGVLSVLMFGRVFQGIMYFCVPPGITIMSFLLCTFYAYKMEKWRSTKIGLALLIFWILSVIGQIVLARFLLPQSRLENLPLRIFICFTSLLLYLCLATLEIYAIICQRYFKGNNKSQDISIEDDGGSHGTSGHIYSRITFAWFNKMIQLGNRKPLTLEDFDPMPYELTARALQNQINVLLAEEKENAKAAGSSPSMLAIIWKMVGPTFAKSVILKIIIDLISLVQPLSVVVIIRYANSILADTKDTLEPHYITPMEFFKNGFVISFCTTVCLLFVQITEQNIRFWNWRNGVKIQTSLFSCFYSKLLRIAPSCTTSGETQVGDVCSILASDTRVIYFFMINSVDLVAIPLRVVVTFIILYEIVGAAAFPGLLLFLCTIPIFVFLPKVLSKFRRSSMRQCNARLAKTAELIGSIRLVKMYGWEDLFTKPVLENRWKEIKEFYTFRMILILADIFCYAIATITGVLTFSTYSIFNEDLVMTRESAFLAFSLIAMLRQMLYMWPVVIMLLINTIVGMRRLKAILLADEVDHPNRKTVMQNFETESDSVTGKSKGGRVTSLFASVKGNKHYGSLKEHVKSENSVKTITHHSQLPRGIAVEIRDATFSWDRTKTLQDINIQFPEGRLTMITGVLGSGKSSLISTILGEIPIIRGSVSLAEKEPSLSLASQIPCIMNLTIKDNILFGSQYQDTRYEAVIRACALNSDFKLMPGGDLTELGENGVNLSGGQKQRINMARALYSDRKVVILDDPFSALDAHVGNYVFKEAISKFLRRDKRTLILVTHHLQHLYKADHLVVMKNGRVEFQGSPNDISNGNYERFVEWAQEYVSSSSESEWDNRTEEETDREKMLLKRKVKADKSQILDFAQDSTVGNLIVDEEQQSGRISLRVYAYYLSSIGFVMCSLTVVVLLMTIAMETSQGLWFARWMEAAQSEFTAEDNIHFIIGYTSLSLGAIIFVSLNLITATTSVFKASVVVFNELLASVVHYPVRYFDVTPVGRILNRFASDTTMLDDNAHLVVNVIFTNLSFIVVPIIINVVISGIFSLCLLPVLIAFFMFLRMYLPVAREIYRCTSVSLSPVFSFFNESSQGSSTIRAFDAQDRFNEEALARMETFNMLFHYQTAVHSWVLLRMDFVCLFLSFFTSVSALLSCIYFSLPSSYVGFVILSTFGLTANMRIIMFGLGQVEMTMNSLERNKEYIDIETEQLSKGTSPGPDWPQQGNISFHRISAKYDKTLEPVLRNITVRVKAGQRVGICGRTGSGKSSLTLTLLRFIDVYQGFILIDGIDISTVPLKILRKKISTIPQDPTLFHGTIRYNLDPEGIKDDKELWEALELAQLKEFTETLDKRLDHVVSQKGSNISVGQRQLFCLARAYIRGSKILIMDEATASVDFETDTVLQKVIRTVFADKTVLTIAHRTSSIVDSDLILVLKDGTLCEHGNPNNLLADPKSAFSSLVEADKVKKNPRGTASI